MSDRDFPADMQSVRAEIVILVPRLRRFCMALTRSVDAGDDLAQSTLERALSRIGQWQPDTRLDSWMFKIARNKFIDDLRAQQRKGVNAGMEALADVQSEDGRDVTERRSTLAKARKAIAALPDDQRALVALVVIDGQSYKDAASILGIPIGTVMSRLARARQSIDLFVNGEAQLVKS